MVRFHQHYHPEGAFTDWQDDHPAGHAIVATIAELHLDATVLPILCDILNPTSPGTSCNLASVASWADSIRDKLPWSAPMHYVNADDNDDHPPQVCKFPGPKGFQGGKNVNVLGAVRNNTDILAQWVQDGSDLDDPTASDALKFLIHFVGDMHQPFHTVARLQGANGISVKWGTEKTSEHNSPWLFVEHDLISEVEFHAMWDGDVVKRAISTTPSKWTKPLAAEIEKHLHGNQYDPLIRKVLVDGINKTWVGEVNSWIKCPTIDSLSHGGPDEQIVLRSQWRASDTDDGSVCPWYWAAPIHNLTCEWIWPKEVDEGKPLVQLDVDWYGGKVTKEWVVERFLTMGGLRLAAILNLIFAHAPGSDV